MANSAGARTWDQVTQELAVKLDVNQPTASELPQGHDGFVEAIVKLARNHQMQDSNAIRTKLRGMHKKIQTFAFMAEGDSSQNGISDKIKALVWTASYAVMKEGLSKHWKCLILIDWIQQLDSRFPDISGNQASLNSNSVIQRILQNIFKHYIDGYAQMIHIMPRHSTSIRNPQDMHNWHSILKQTEMNFERSKRVYDVACSAVTEAHNIAGQTTMPEPISELEESRGDTRADSLSLSFCKGLHIDKGNSSRVYRVKEKSTNDLYAVKYIPADSGDSSPVKEKTIKDEIATMRRLSHHHITTLTITSKGPGGFNLFIRPWAELDLQSLLTSKPGEYKFEPEIVDHWFGCLISALSYSHSCEVKHRDIKPANILIYTEKKHGDRILLTDFGLARDYSDTHISDSNGNKPVGAEKYRAPESFLQDTTRLLQTDVFALGCVYAEILNYRLGRRMSDFDEERRDVCKDVRFARFAKHFHEWLDKIHSELHKRKDFKGVKVMQELDSMLDTIPESRSTAKDLAEERFTKAHGLCCDKCSRSR